MMLCNQRPHTLPPDPFPQLTIRQLEVVRCVMAGDTDRQIAAYLDLPVSNVRRYVSRACDRLGLADRDAILWLS